MRRREFITLLGGAAAAGRSRRARSRASGCGGLACSSPKPLMIRTQARIAAFLQGLQQLGWTVGRNVRIDIRWSAGNSTTFADTRRIGRACAGRHPGRAVRPSWPLLQATRACRSCSCRSRSGRRRLRR